MFKRYLLVFYALGFMLLWFGCKRNDETEKTPVNSFSLVLNDKLWQPSIMNNDVCYAAYRCEWSAYNQIPLYTINAYKDSQGRTNYNSENSFRLQIMNVQDTGIYHINESYSDFNSYARFIINESGSQKIYENSTTRPTSKVRIDQMLPKENSGLVGIKGTFSGILYCVNNQNDSIIIKDCKFTFNKINWVDFCQCDQ